MPSKRNAGNRVLAKVAFRDEMGVAELRDIAGFLACPDEIVTQVYQRGIKRRNGRKAPVETSDAVFVGKNVQRRAVLHRIERAMDVNVRSEAIKAKPKVHFDAKYQPAQPSRQAIE